MMKSDKKAKEGDKIGAPEQLSHGLHVSQHVARIKEFHLMTIILGLVYC